MLRRGAVPEHAVRIGAGLVGIAQSVLGRVALAERLEHRADLVLDELVLAREPLEPRALRRPACA